MLRLALAALLVMMCFAGPKPAQAQQQSARLALLIGNQGYNERVGPLRNPHNDIALVGSALREVGFTLLDPVKDASRDDMLEATHELGGRLRQAGRGAIGFLYYTGHGVAVGGENVLVPANAPDTSDRTLNVRGVKLGDLLDILKREAPEAVIFVVIDACRNTMRGQRGAKGFVPVTDQRTGIVLAFATAAGDTASDDGARSGPYAEALAAEIVKPGLNDQQVFNAVRAEVVRKTRTQTPWTHDGLIGERVVFKPAAAQPTAPQAPPPPQVTTPAAPTQMSAAAEAWPHVRDSTSIPDIEDYIRRFGDTYFGDLAKRRLAALKDEQMRVALLAKQGDERKRAEAAAAAKAGEERRKAAEEAAKRDPANSVTPGSGQSFKDRLADGSDCAFCPEMVVVPAGSFMMGSPESESGRSSNEGPQRRVTIARPFAVGKFEVTFAEWEACVEDSGPWSLFGGPGCTHRPGAIWGGGRQPVMNVSWDDAKQYVEWLSRRTGKTYRLLTEAEWEFAARAGTTTKYFWGNEFLNSNANNDKGRTVPVGQYPPNRWGLYDVHGNVWEWVEDCYADTYFQAPTDGSRAPDTTNCPQVLRGGSWSNNPNALRSAYRGRYHPDNRNDDVGFRLARTLFPH